MILLESRNPECHTIVLGSARTSQSVGKDFDSTNVTWIGEGKVHVLNHDIGRDPRSTLTHSGNHALHCEPPTKKPRLDTKLHGGHGHRYGGHTGRSVSSKGARSCYWWRDFEGVKHLIWQGEGWEQEDFLERLQQERELSDAIPRVQCAWQVFLQVLVPTTCSEHWYEKVLKIVRSGTMTGCSRQWRPSCMATGGGGGGRGKAAAPDGLATLQRFQWSWEHWGQGRCHFLGCKMLLLGLHFFLTPNFLWDTKNFFRDTESFLGFRMCFSGYRSFFWDTKVFC